MQSAKNLVRKQYYIELRQVVKLNQLAKQQKKSVAEVVRMAIDAFNPVMPAVDLNESELLALVSKRVKEAKRVGKKSRAGWT